MKMFIRIIKAFLVFILLVIISNAEIWIKLNPATVANKTSILMFSLISVLCMLIGFIITIDAEKLISNKRVKIDKTILILSIIIIVISLIPTPWLFIYVPYLTSDGILKIFLKIIETTRGVTVLSVIGGVLLSRSIQPRINSENLDGKLND
ncbi:hypothetical protein QBE53_01745 [Vallitaleaceae bacterium 9-2]